MRLSSSCKWVWSLPDLSFTVPSWSSLLQHNQAPFILSITLSDWATVHLLCSGLSFAQQCVLFLLVALQDTQDRCCHLAQTSWGIKVSVSTWSRLLSSHWSFDYLTPDTSTWNNTWNLTQKQKATRRSGGTETGRKNGFCLVQCFPINRMSMVLYVLCNTTSPLKKE